MSSRLPALTQRIASKHGIETGDLIVCAERADRFLDDVRDMLRATFPLDTLPGIDIVLIGSIAKRQCTKGSDLDFFGVTSSPLQPGQTDPIIRAMLDFARDAGYELPFAGGPTGVFVPRAELEKFDLLNDGNRHLMRRTTLVTGSVSVYRPELRAEILRNALSSFVGREREPRISGIFDQLVMRGRVTNLSTEMMRDHRTGSDGGLLPWAKARTLYRIELAGALAAVIRAELATQGRSREDLIESLAVHLDVPPIERWLAWYDDLSAEGQQSLAAIVSVTAATLRLLATEGVRTRLFALADDEPTRALERSFEDQIRALDASLVQLFYREPVFRPWIEKLGLFG
jgi:hypothetical protein